jgi:glycosyltransferase involved in cell wall biosynthesis
MTATRVSIVICTRNRADSLRATIASIAECSVPADFDVELIVVDNGSTDETSKVAALAGLSNMPLRYHVELRKGLCHARNRGLAEGLGDIFLFTDDDIRVPTDWIPSMCQPIIRREADATQGEIKIAPGLEKPWLTPAHRAHLTEVGELSTQHGRQPFLIGANMAFSREVLRDVGGFETILGAGGLGYMDDTLFYLQLLQAGKKIKFVAGARVEHHFDACRLTRKDQLRAAVAHGKSTAWVMHHWSHQRLPCRRLRMARNAIRLFWAQLRWRFGPQIGFDPHEITHATRYWTYRELGRIAKQRRVYERQGLRRLTTPEGLDDQCPDPIASTTPL